MTRKLPCNSMAFSFIIIEGPARRPPTIELVDGEKLASMFEVLELGVRARTVYEVDEEFFEEFAD